MMNRRVFIWVIAIFLGVGVLTQPKLAQAAPLFQADSCEVLNEEGEELYRQAQYTEALQKFQEALTCYREQEDRAGESRSLNNIGLIYRSQGRYEEALDYYEQAVNIGQELGPSTEVLVTFSNTGSMSWSLGRHEEALFYYQQALTISREIGIPTSESATLNNIGLIYESQGQYEEALQFFEQALAIRREIGDRAGESTTLNNIGSIYYRLGQYEEALETFRQALFILREVGDREGEGITLNNLGLVYEAQGDYTEALEFYQQALTIIQEIDDRVGKGIILNNIGAVYNAQGRYTEALEFYQQALEIVREVDDLASEGNTLSNLGLVYEAGGRYAEALEYFEQALQIARELGDRRKVAESLNSIGVIYSSQGRYQEALALYQQALEIRREIGDRRGEAESLNSIGVIYSSQGQYEEALTYYQQALAIRQELGDRRGEAESLNTIGIIYSSLGQYRGALDYYQQALTIRQEIGDRRGQAESLNTIGAIYSNQEQYDKALELYQQALEIRREIGDRRGEGESLNSIGAIYSSLGQYDKALELYQQALEIRREIGERRGEAESFNRIGVIYSALEQYELALDYYEQAFEIRREIGDRRGEGESLNNIGGIYESLGQFDTTLTYYQQAVDVFEELRGAITVEELKSSFTGEQEELYDRIIDLLIRMGRFEEAFGYVQRAKERTFIDQLANVRIDPKVTDNPELLNREQELLGEIRALEEVLLGNRNFEGTAHSNPRPLTDEQYHEVQERLDVAYHEYEQLLIQIKLSNPEYASLVTVNTLTLTETQQLLTDTTLVEYYVLPEQTLTFVVTPDDFHSLPISITGEALNRAISGWRSYPVLDDSVPPPSLELYELLLAPIGKHLHTNAVYIAPHDVLHYLPFGALHDGKRYLLDDYVLLTVPSASALRWLQETRKPDTNTVLALGNPTTELPLDLRYAQQEVEFIADLYGTQALVGTNATENMVWSQAKKASILHLAAPGYFNNNSPLFSAIYLASDGKYDGRLEVHEIYGLDLTSTNLVVLSGCETQLDALSDGNELVGLNRAFLYAGVPSVITSLWGVNDKATALLMGRFYTHLRDGMGEARALRQAQIEVRQDYPNPYYWAGFVLIGSPDPKSFVPPPSPWPWLVGLGGGLVVVLISGFTSLTRSSGLPPTLLLRQKWSLIPVGLEYGSYHKRWASGTPLEQLVVLLIPAEECLNIKQISQKLTEWRVPADVEQIQTALDTAVRDGLFLRQAGGYCLAEPRLARALQAHEGPSSCEALVERIRHDHPLCANARRFLERANFKLRPLDESLLYRCEPTSVDFQRLLSDIVHARLLPGESLNGEQVLAIRGQVKQVDAQASVVFAITDQRATNDGWAQIGTLRMPAFDFKVLPIESTLINEGLTTGRERTLLRIEIEKRLGTDYDPYDVRDPVAGAFSFFGRDALVETLLRRIGDGRPVGIFGLRKLGKSSLLHALRDRASFPVALVNLQTLSSGTMEGLYRRILRYWAQWVGARYELDWVPPSISAQDATEAFVAATLTLLERLEQHVEGEVRLGVFLDEVELMIPRPDERGASLSRYLTLFRALRGLVDEDGRVSLVVASLNPAINRINAWQGEQNPTFSLFQEVNLAPLKDEDCIQMVRNIGAQIGLVYSDESLQAISKLSGGHPFLARQLCSLLYRERGRQPGRIDMSTLPLAVQRFMSDEEFTYHLDNGIWQEVGNPTLWGDPAANQSLLLELARADGPVPHDELLKSPEGEARRSALYNLKRFHIIHQEADMIAIRFGLLRKWLRKRYLP